MTTLPPITWYSKPSGGLATACSMPLLPGELLTRRGWPAPDQRRPISPRRAVQPLYGCGMTSTNWPAAEAIETARLILEPLRVDHAAQMAPALDDERLHEFIGGQPATLEQLQERYGRQVVGRSADGTQGWCNWVVRHRGTGAVVGTVQATLHTERGRTAAEIAWVVAVPHQGQGYASEAAAGMAGWLARHGAEVLVAHVHPEHHASIGVARALGLSPTDVIVDGEIRWTT